MFQESVSGHQQAAREALPRRLQAGAAGTGGAAAAVVAVDAAPAVPAVPAAVLGHLCQRSRMVPVEHHPIDSTEPETRSCRLIRSHHRRTDQTDPSHRSHTGCPPRSQCHRSLPLPRFHPAHHRGCYRIC